MVVYYLGNPAEKKKKMTEDKDGVYLDNDEVLAIYGKGNRYYFVTGRAAFADFTVWEYLSYTKSLELRRPLKLDEAKALIARTGSGVKLNKRLKHVDLVTLKAIKLAAALKSDTSKIYHNFDGLMFSRKNLRRMQKLISSLSCYEIIISVSDIKFVPSGGAIQWFLGNDARTYKSKIIKQGSKAIKLFS